MTSRAIGLAGMLLVTTLTVACGPSTPVTCVEVDQERCDRALAMARDAAAGPASDAVRFEVVADCPLAWRCDDAARETLDAVTVRFFGPNEIPLGEVVVPDGSGEPQLVLPR